jgi:transcriptional regulator with XRE-family HTH domain
MKPILDIQRLKEMREAKGWSKNRAAEEIGILQSSYLRYENGESAPSYSVIRLMALALDTSVGYLTNKSDDKTPVDFIVSNRDKRLRYVIDTYLNLSDSQKDNLVMYAKKLLSE